MSKWQFKVVLLFLVVLSGQVLTACSDRGYVGEDVSSDIDESVAASFIELPRHHTKKGAYIDVKFSHDYDGKTELFETETFGVRVASGYDHGLLHLSLVTKDGLELGSESEIEFEMTGEDLGFPVSVTPSTADTHFIRVIATLHFDGFDPVMQVWGVAIHVEDDLGLGRFSQKLPSAVQLDENTDPLMVLKADEVIY